MLLHLFIPPVEENEGSLHGFDLNGPEMAGDSKILLEVLRLKGM